MPRYGTNFSIEFGKNTFNTESKALLKVISEKIKINYESNIFEICSFFRRKRMVQKLIIIHGPKKSPVIFYIMYVQNAILKIETKKISNYIQRKITPDLKKFLLKPKSKLNHQIMMTMKTKILKKNSSNPNPKRKYQQKDFTILILTQQKIQM